MSEKANNLEEEVGEPNYENDAQEAIDNFILAIDIENNSSITREKIVERLGDLQGDFQQMSIEQQSYDCTAWNNYYVLKSYLELEVLLRSNNSEHSFYKSLKEAKRDFEMVTDFGINDDDKEYTYWINLSNDLKGEYDNLKRDHDNLKRDHEDL